MGFINRIDSVLKEYRDRNCLADREEQRKLTYRNLDELSGKAAVKLRALGIRKGDTVMIRIGRCGWARWRFLCCRPIPRRGPNTSGRTPG